MCILNLNIAPQLRMLLMVASIVVIVGGMKAISSILNAFLLAILIATLCIPFEGWLQRRGMRHGVAFALTLLLSLLVGLGTVLFFGLSIFQVIQELPKYQAELQGYLDSISVHLQAFGFTPGTVTDTLASSSQQIIQAALQILRSIVGTLGTIFLMYLFLLFILMDVHSFPTRLRGVLEADHPLVVRAMQFVVRTREYLVVRTILGAGIAGLQTIVMLVMGVDFALLWGLLSFICNYIPNIGFIISVIPPAAILFLEQGPVPALIFVVLFTIINNVMENLVGPKVYGTHVNLSPLSVTLSLVFWTWVLGPIGAILALPLTLFVKGVLLEADAGNSIVIALMSSSSREPENPPSANPTIEP